MNPCRGSTYPLVGIGRVCFADDATAVPTVLMDDGYSSTKEHDHILSTFRKYHSEMEITTDGVWEPMPHLDHTGQKHHYLNITATRHQK